MRTGVIVGHGDVDDVFSRPRHPYTASLLEPPGPTSVSVGALIAMTNPARAMIALLIALTAHKRGGRELETMPPRIVLITVGAATATAWAVTHDHHPVPLRPAVARLAGSAGVRHRTAGQ